MKSPHFPIDPRTDKGETQNRKVATYSSNVEAFYTEPDLEKKHEDRNSTCNQNLQTRSWKFLNEKLIRVGETRPSTRTAERTTTQRPSASHSTAFTNDSSKSFFVYASVWRVYWRHSKTFCVLRIARVSRGMRYVVRIPRECRLTLQATLSELLSTYLKCTYVFCFCFSESLLNERFELPESQRDSTGVVGVGVYFPYLRRRIRPQTTRVQSYRRVPVWYTDRFKNYGIDAM